MRNEFETKEAFQSAYNYVLNEDIETLYSIAEKAYLDRAFPFAPEITSIPENRPRAYDWIYECMREIAEKSGCSAMTHYSENGISITWDKSGISQGLLNRITPQAGIV
ncbi:MAG: hypothetical protein J5662_01290 [Clostridia bacterium]|jgi:hypothetical protein|nr:hypothetical protein [Clostridia bacterium]